MKKPSAGPDTKNVAKSSKAVLLSVAVGSVLSFLLLCAFAALMSIRDLPHSAVIPLPILAVAAGTVGAGYCCARLLRERGLLWGLLCGSVIFLLALASEVAILRQPIGVLALYKYVVYAASGMIGGVLGVNRKRRPSR